MKRYIIKQIDTVLTVYACEADSKVEAKQKWFGGEVNKIEQGEVVDSVLEIEEGEF